jgi:general secretion pathway protein C
VQRGFASIDRRSLEWTALASSAVLGAIAVWLFARLIWLLVPRGDALGETAVHVGPSEAGGASGASIAKWHLFGNTPVAAGGAGASASQSMILRGTLADRDAGSGVAVIDAGDGEQAYRAGEAIASGVKLARVYPDHAIVVRDGAEETLTLTRDRNLQPAEIVRQPGPGGARTDARGTASQSAASARSNGAGQTVRASPELQQTIDRLRQNPEELAHKVQIVPVLDGGRLTGVRVSTGMDTALMSQIGLRPGDIVTAVNGAPVDSLARGQQIIEGLRNAASARVTVLRDGKSTDITISLK